MWDELQYDVAEVYPVLKSMPHLLYEKRSTTNHIIGLRDTSGQYVLRIHLGTLTYSEMLSTIAIQDHVAWNLSIGPHVFRTLQGFKAGMIAGRLVVLMSDVPGSRNAFRCPEDVYGILGRTLGKLHAALSSVPVSMHGPAHLNFIEDKQEVIEQLESCRSSHRRCAHVAAAADVRRKALARLAGEGLDPASFSRGLIHGDFHQGNILVDDCGDLRGILDFDRSGEFFYSYELYRGFFLALSMRDDYRGWARYLARYIGEYRRYHRLDDNDIINGSRIFLWIIAGDTTTMPLALSSVATSFFVECRNHLIEWLVHHRAEVEQSVRTILENNCDQG